MEEHVDEQHAFYLRNNCERKYRLPEIHQSNPMWTTRILLVVGQAPCGSGRRVCFLRLGRPLRSSHLTVIKSVVLPYMCLSHTAYPWRISPCFGTGWVFQNFCSP